MREFRERRGGDRGDRGGYRGGGGDRGDRGGGRRDFGGDRGDSMAKPVKEGEEYDITIEAVGAKGDGIGKVNNFVVFVPGGQVGERMRIRIERVLSRFALAQPAGEASSPKEAESTSEGSSAEEPAESSQEEAGGDEEEPEGQ